jgi:hypothetical protein
MIFNSQIGQDLVVLKYLSNKKNGTFIDIGCGYPIYINNTYTLEKYFDWYGVSIDLFDYKELDGSDWHSVRNTKRILSNALDINYEKLFSENNLPLVIDYLTMDLEPPQLTLECLYKIPFNKYRFNIISFEVDKNREGDFERINKSRELLNSYGYILLGSLCGGQDDIYIHQEMYESVKHIDFEDQNIIWTFK